MPWQLATVMPLDIGTETDNGDYQATLDRCLAEFGWAEKSEAARPGASTAAITASRSVAISKAAAPVRARTRGW